MRKAALLLFCIAIGINAHQDEDIICPFHRTDRWENCVRSQDLIEDFDRNIDQMNLRPDIRTLNATTHQLVEQLMCCYEDECLKECGLDVNTLFPTPETLTRALKNAIPLYPAFFLEYDPEEVADILNGVATEKIVMNWKVKFAHLVLVAPKVLKQQQAMGKLVDREF
ncbi:unnamed protein product [Caenorhabditis angaria]|uniref:Uncharacterized protein n=1 Tax=Caenorhabditis angaria TaxID=860376 RepID=A0A9P1J011_9PELO|nr:unnamed protein product [Caenorhabditis angaria]